jgi:16S rRNA processing protein RimM
VYQRPEFISIGVIVKAHGIKGQFVVKPLTDELDQFYTFESIYLTLNGKTEKHDIIDVNVSKNLILMQLRDIKDRNTAENFKGAMIEIMFADARELAEDEYFIFDLIGLEAKTIQGEYIGEIIDVWQLPANDVYVLKSGDKEILLPAIKEVVKSISLDQNELIIDPMDGLLDNDENSHH